MEVIRVRPPPSNGSATSKNSVAPTSSADFQTGSASSVASKKHPRLQVVLDATRNFCEESTIHGLIYIGGRGSIGWIWRLVWVGVVVACFSWAVVIIADSYADWMAHPVETIIVDPVYHVSNVQYPTVTVSRAQNINERTWGIVARYLNKADFPCSQETSKCVPNHVWKRTFFPLFRRIFRNKLTVETSALSNDTLSCSTESVLSALMWRATNGGPGVTREVEELIISQLHLNISAEQFIHDYLFPLLNSSQVDQEDPCTWETTLHPVVMTVHHLYDLRRFRVGLGTFLESLSSLFMPNGEQDADLIADMTPFNNLLTSALNCLAPGNDGLKMSLLDVSLLTATPNPSNYFLRRTSERLLNSSIGLMARALCGLDDLRNLGKMWRWSRQGTAKQELVNPCAANIKDKPFCCAFWRNIVSNFPELIFEIKREASFMASPGHRDNPTMDAAMADCLKNDGVPTDKNHATFDDKDNLLVPYCSYDRQDCGNFQPVFGVHGLAYSLNSFSGEELFAPSYYMRMFNRIFNIATKSRVRRNRGSGQSYVTTLVLDAHNENRSNFTQMFAFAVGSASTPFEINQNEYQVEAGVRTSLRVSLSQLVSRAEIRRLSVESRNCMFGDELELNITDTLSSYTKIGCEFSCVLKSAINECMCIPWNSAKPSGDTSPTCTIYGALCFRQQMADVTRMRKCGCFDDCNSIQFTFTDSRENIKAADFCMDSADSVYQYIEQRSMRSLYADRLLGRSNWVDATDANSTAKRNASLCVDFVQNNLAVVDIVLPSPSLMTMEKRLRMTMTEQIGVLGGMLGLFTGISIMSMVEILFFLKTVVMRLLYYVP